MSSVPSAPPATRWTSRQADPPAAGPQRRRSGRRRPGRTSGAPRAPPPPRRCRPDLAMPPSSIRLSCRSNSSTAMPSASSQAPSARRRAAAAQPRQHPAAEALRDIAVAEDRPSQRPHEAEFVDRADIGRGAAERGQVGDQRVAAADMRLVRPVDAAPFRQGRVRHQRRRLEREDPGHAVRGTDGPLGGGDVRRIGKEDLGPGQISCIASSNPSGPRDAPAGAAARPGRRASPGRSPRLKRRSSTRTRWARRKVRCAGVQPSGFRSARSSLSLRRSPTNSCAPGRPAALELTAP